MMKNKLFQRLLDGILYVFAFLFTWTLFDFGVWVMDVGFPMSMLLGFIICSSATLTFVALVMELIEEVKGKFLNKR